MVLSQYDSYEPKGMGSIQKSTIPRSKQISKVMISHNTSVAPLKSLSLGPPEAALPKAPGSSDFHSTSIASVAHVTNPRGVNSAFTMSGPSNSKKLHSRSRDGLTVTAHGSYRSSLGGHSLSKGASAPHPTPSLYMVMVLHTVEVQGVKDDPGRFDPQEPGVPEDSE